EDGKLTFLGAHYTGGPDLVALAGTAAERFYWTTSYTLTSEKGPGTDFQLALAKRFNRGDKVTNSTDYTNGIMVTQVAIEAIKRVLDKGGTISRKSLYDELNAMNGANAYDPQTTVGSVTFSKTDRAGVDTLQLYQAQKGVFRAVGQPFTSDYYRKIK
ncbi:MAG: ABC transporter substrate-binding protein, partial [Proteobacteria bacterium]|nr:ABC transporter substrate-binding protein [Pseudomonadota bacterium]